MRSRTGVAEDVDRVVRQLVAPQDAGAQRVVDVVVEVGDAIDDPDDPTLERRRLGRAAGVAEDAVADGLAEVQALEVVDDAQRVLPVTEAGAEALAQARVESVLADVAEGRVPEVVAEADRLREVLVEAERAGDGPRDLRDLERVRQPRAEVVALGGDEHLRLVLQATERAAVDDPVAVALERRAQPAVRPPAPPGARDRSGSASGDSPASSHAARRAAYRAATAPVGASVSITPLSQRERGSLPASAASATAARRCTPAWCSAVSVIARSAWRRAWTSASGASRQRRAERTGHERVRLLAQRERTRLARAADDAAGRAREADELLRLPARRAGAELRREARGDEQLEAERELVRPRRALRLAVEQRELVAEQVVRRRMRLAVAEEAVHRVARAHRAVERGGRGRADARARRPCPRR